MNNNRCKNLVWMMELSDSTFPVGTFSFSNTLESAVTEKVVHDRDTLSDFVSAVSHQAAFTDGIASQIAYRYAQMKDLNGIILADTKCFNFKLNTESRQMACRMGKKMGEIFSTVTNSSLMNSWLECINKNQTPGTYSIAQAIAFSECQLTPEELFSAQQYGTINMVLSAALRLLKISHYETQKILYCLAQGVSDLYEQIKGSGFNQMNCFMPELEIFASIHEKGKMRMFMN